MSDAFEIDVKTVPSLASSAMLVGLNIGVWTGRKLDKKSGAEIDEVKKTKTRVTSATKNLFAGMEELDKIRSYVANVRIWHNMHTHPWNDSGTRLLPMSNYFDYVKQMTSFREGYEELVNKFHARYPEMIEIAAFTHGDLFDRTEYPNASGILHKFYFEVAYYPVPERGDIRVNVQEDVKAELVEQFDKFYHNKVIEVNKNQWERLKDILAHLVDRLADKSKEEVEAAQAKIDARNSERERLGLDAIDSEVSDRRRFRKGLVENAHEDITLLKGMDLTGNQDFKRACEEVEKVLDGMTTGLMKEDDEARRSTHKAVNDILDKFNF